MAKLTGTAKLVAVTSLLTANFTVQAQQADPLGAIAEFWSVAAKLRPEERRNHYHYDFKRGYIVSRFGITRLNAQQVPFYVDPPERESGLDFGGIDPYRRLKRIEGYALVEGNLTLPTTLTGVTQSGEAAYNYFGIQRGSDDVEAGVVSSTVTTPGRWFAFFHLGNTWGPTPPWPTGGMAPGSSVSMRLSIVPPRTISFYISYTEPDPNLIPQEATFTLGSEELDPYGKQQRVRRVTSLLLNPASGSSVTNSWAAVKLGAFLSNSVLWQPIHTQEAVTHLPQYVTVNEVSQYHAESVSIQAP